MVQQIGSLSKKAQNQSSTANDYLAGLQAAIEAIFFGKIAKSRISSPADQANFRFTPKELKCMNQLYLSGNSLTNKVHFKQLISLIISLLSIPAFCVPASLNLDNESFSNKLTNEGIMEELSTFQQQKK
ncbi:hypothetical protein [Proteiniphilum sp. X52]|uniref:hypothetical protein n=1 Tax=Proteiniphilum sp. X52 TaxID=2382159 RepID=UPI000F09DE93|nr:hypothetical protein [Proteiniphilum sp. X52]RNC65740.1 hypothetical protein D7D25_06235 [Proteiniphilum sp. X52]